MSNESIAEVASQATYAGAGISAGASATHLVFGRSVDEWTVYGIIFGMAIALVGLVVNFYFRQKHLDLAKRLGSETVVVEDGD